MSTETPDPMAEAVASKLQGINLLDEYARLHTENERTSEKHGHSELFDWEVEALERIRRSIGGDLEASALFAHLVNFAMMKSRCAKFPG